MREVAAQRDALAVAQARLALIERAAALAQDTVQSQQTRFEQGRATAIDVVRVSQRLSEVELRLARVRADMAIAHALLDELTGQLIELAL